MKVADLVNKLLSLPQDADVLSVWDGEPRTDINAVWLSRSGRVMLCDVDDVVYSEESRPLWSPSQKESPYWEFQYDAGQNSLQQRHPSAKCQCGSDAVYHYCRTCWCVEAISYIIQQTKCAIKTSAHLSKRCTK